MQAHGRLILQVPSITTVVQQFNERLEAVCNPLRPHVKISRMADFGEVTYINAAVQVIPVLAIFAVADSFVRRRDVEDSVERIFASTAVAVGLLFGIGGEVFGLQALLTGPTRQTIPTVNAGLMALGATVLVPRLAELHVPRNPDLARRIAYRLLPRVIGIVGIVTATSRAPLGFRLFIYALSALTILSGLADASALARRSRTTPTPPSVTKPEPSSDQPADSPPTDARRSVCWWLMACLTGVAIGARIGRRKKIRHGGCR
jgi:hypothetical protein